MHVLKWQLCAQGDASAAIQEMKPAEVFPIKAGTAWEDLNNNTKKENKQLELPFTSRQKVGERYQGFGESEKKG